jgi:hypothetical protein
MLAIRHYLPGGAAMIRFLVGFALAACTLGYLVAVYIEVDPLIAAENFGYFMALSISLMFMKFGFSSFKFWTTDNDVKNHLVSQWDRVFGISGWLLLCVGIVSALTGSPEKVMESAALAVYGLFYSYTLKGFVLTALYPNPDDDMYYVETNHNRYSKIERANEAVLH